MVEYETTSRSSWTNGIKNLFQYKNFEVCAYKPMPQFCVWTRVPAIKGLVPQAAGRVQPYRVTSQDALSPGGWEESINTPGLGGDSHSGCEPGCWPWILNVLSSAILCLEHEPQVSVPFGNLLCMLGGFHRLGRIVDFAFKSMCTVFSPGNL